MCEGRQVSHPHCIECGDDHPFDVDCESWHKFDPADTAPKLSVLELGRRLLESAVRGCAHWIATPWRIARERKAQEAAAAALAEERRQIAVSDAHRARLMPLIDAHRMARRRKVDAEFKKRRDDFHDALAVAQQKIVDDVAEKMPVRLSLVQAPPSTPVDEVLHAEDEETYGTQARAKAAT
jgi:hypothetical protein